MRSAGAGVIVDFVGYEALLEYIEERSLCLLPGDLIEIGAFLGGGTAKLAGLARTYEKRVFAVDIFDHRRDQTRDATGARMSDIYEAFLEGRSQLDVYRSNIEGYDNIVTVQEDSGNVEFPDTQRFVFGFIDGNHEPEHVRSDFYLVWRHLVPGGAVGFHDYNFDLPEVTTTIDSLLYSHRKEIGEVREIADRHVLLLRKRTTAEDTA